MTSGSLDLHILCKLILKFFRCANCPATASWIQDWLSGKQTHTHTHTHAHNSTHLHIRTHNIPDFRPFFCVQGMHNSGFSKTAGWLEGLYFFFFQRRFDLETRTFFTYPKKARVSGSKRCLKKKKSVVECKASENICEKVRTFMQFLGEWKGIINWSERMFSGLDLFSVFVCSTNVWGLPA